jgi:hypothetical protein
VALAVRVGAGFLPPARRLIAGLLACAVGLCLLPVTDFSLAGPAYVPFAGLTVYGRWAGKSIEEAKTAWRNFTGAPEPVEVNPPPAEWLAVLAYFSPEKVVLSSLAWGLLAGGIITLARSGRRFRAQKEPDSAFGVLGAGLMARWAEGRSLARIARQVHPPYGVLLGVEQGTGRPVIITDREANQHLLGVGTTGTGKTTMELNFAESAIQRGLSLVVVDGKGDPDFAERIRTVAEKHGRTFRLFAMHGPSCHYDPLARGGITERKEKLLYLTEWSEPHYEALAGRYLQLVFRVFEKTGLRPDLMEVAEHLDPDRLALIVRKIPERTEQAGLFEVLDTFKTGEIRGLAARLAALTESEIGHLFRRQGVVIDLMEAIGKGQVVMFSLDSLAFPEYARLLGRLVVADLKCAAARAYRECRRPVYCIFDEFNVFASRTVVDLIGKARGAGFCALIATQGLSDIEAAAGAPVVEQIIGNCNTFIIQRQNSPAAAEKLAGLIGTRRSVEVTRQVEDTILGRRRTGLGTVREVREYVVHPDEIKTLRTGEAIVVRKSVGSVQRVWIRKVLP